MKTIITSNTTNQIEIPIVFITDNNFVLPTSVAITSLILNKACETVYKIYILMADDVNYENRKKLTAYKAENISIELMNISTDHINNHLNYEHVSNLCLLKFDISDLFPQHDKILYLDGDILVKKDLTELYNTNINNFLLAGVSDITFVKFFDYFSELNISNYFNAGILLLNTKLLRDEKIRGRLYKERENPSYRYIDQDVWNVVCKDKILWLPFKYNNMIINIKEFNISIDDISHYYGLNYESEKAMKQDTYIFHLCGKIKPWKHKDAFMSKEWISYFKKSPFRDQKLFLFYYKNKEPILRKKIKRLLKKILVNLPIIKQLDRRYWELIGILNENNIILKEIRENIKRLEKK
jgi:lipopolysaccharide biosynthesis glycosyltransferase